MTSECIDFSEDRSAVLFLVIAMLASLVIAGFVVLYVAYPHRGQRLPGVPWLGALLGRAAGAAPVIADEERDLARRR